MAGQPGCLNNNLALTELFTHVINSVEEPKY